LTRLRALGDVRHEEVPPAGTAGLEGEAATIPRDHGPGVVTGRVLEHLSNAPGGRCLPDGVAPLEEEAFAVGKEGGAGRHIDALGVEALRHWRGGGTAGAVERLDGGRSLVREEVRGQHTYRR